MMTHACHRLLGVVVKDDHGVGAIFRRRDLRQVDGAALDARMVDRQPSAHLEQLDRQLAVFAE